MLLILIGSLGCVITEVEVLLCPLAGVLFGSYDAVVGRLFEIVTFCHCLLFGIVEVAVLLNCY